MAFLHSSFPDKSGIFRASFEKKRAAVTRETIIPSRNVDILEHNLGGCVAMLSPKLLWKTSKFTADFENLASLI